MKAPQLTREQKHSRFRAIVDRRERMSVDWQLTPEGEAIVARLLAGQSLDPVLTFDVNADRNDITAVAMMPDDQDFLIYLVRDLGQQLAALQPQDAANPPKRQMTTANYAGRLLGNYDFQKWMFEVQDFEKVNDKEALKTRLRGMLAISSLNDLNTDEAARKRYFSLVNAFEAWNKKRKR